VYHPNIRFLVDRSIAGFVRQLKGVFGVAQDHDYKDVSPETMEILPISFSTPLHSILHGLIRITIRTIVATKFVTVISVLIPKKNRHEQKQDEITESP
jgi:hypothetical protein